MNQGDLLRDEALDRLEDSHEDWIQKAVSIIRAIARIYPTLTSDMVWKSIETAPKEPRAMGAAFREAARRGYIEPTDRVQKSKRPACHSRPIRVWRSRILLEVEV